MKLTGTAVCKTVSHIFQRYAFCLWRTLPRYDVLCVP